MEHRRAAPLILGFSLTFALVLGLTYVMAGSSRPRSSLGVAAPPDRAPLLVNNVTLQDDGRDDSVAVVQYDVGWEGDTFPGVYECTWRVFGKDGSLVGAYSTPVVTLQKLVTGITKEIPVSEPGATAEAACATTRLDTGPYQYAISNVAASKDPSGGVRITFSSGWLGEGTPGVVRCEVTLTSATSTELVRSTFNFAAGTPNTNENLVRLPDVSPDVADLVAGARIECLPYT
jgi:hypothetical protein